jgi:hypothetical protein
MKAFLVFLLGHMQTTPKEFRRRAPGQNSPLFGAALSAVVLGCWEFSLPASRE